LGLPRASIKGGRGAFKPRFSMGQAQPPVLGRGHPVPGAQAGLIPCDGGKTSRAGTVRAEVSDLPADQAVESRAVNLAFSFGI
jgi:hypothetical protein